jgi:hypothetical protein
MAAGPELDAAVLTLNTLDGDVARDPAFWTKLGVPYKTRINEDWYTRLGYTAFRRGIPRYPSVAADGSEFLAEAVVSRQVWRLESTGASQGTDANLGVVTVYAQDSQIRSRGIDDTHSRESEIESDERGHSWQRTAICYGTTTSISSCPVPTGPVTPSRAMSTAPIMRGPPSCQRSSVHGSHTAYDSHSQSSSSRTVTTVPSTSRNLLQTESVLVNCRQCDSGVVSSLPTHVR